MDLRANAVGSPQQGMAYPVTTTASPKEIGMLQRIDGVRSGVAEIEGRLAAFLEKLAGSPPNASLTQRAMSSGLSGTVDEAEAGIRECLSMLRKLDDGF